MIGLIEIKLVANCKNQCFNSSQAMGESRPKCSTHENSNIVNRQYDATTLVTKYAKNDMLSLRYRIFFERAVGEFLLTTTEGEDTLGL